MPPRVDYELTERARDVLPVVGALATWGYAWAWSPPRPGEAVDIGAILRASTGLAIPARSKVGTIEITVTGGRAKPTCHYTLRVGRGAMTIAEQETPDADARIAGSERAWVDAFGPAASRRGLTVEGDEALADAVLSLCCGTRLATAGVSAVA